MRARLSWHVPFTLPFPLPPVRASIIVSENTQTESVPQACGKAEMQGIVPMPLWHWHTSPGFSAFWPLTVWKQTNRSLFAILSSVFCYVSLNLLWKWYQQGSYLHCCQCVLGQLKAYHAWGIRGRRCRQCWVTGGGWRLLAVFCRSSKKVLQSKPVLIDTLTRKSQVILCLVDEIQWCS